VPCIVTGELYVVAWVLWAYNMFQRGGMAHIVVAEPVVARVHAWEERGRT